MKDTTPQAVQTCHELLFWLIPQLERFPRARRFTLGERIESALIDVLECLVDAAYSRDKHEALVTANRRLEVIRHLWRLAHELKLVSTGHRKMEGWGTSRRILRFKMLS